MLSIFRNMKQSFPVDSNRDDLFSIEQVYNLISLKKKFSDYEIANLDNWPFIIKSFETITKEEYKVEKTKLPTIYFSVKAIDLKNPKELSGFFCIDIDYDENKQMIDLFGLEELKKRIYNNISSTVLIFISPSKKGLKIVHKINISGDTSEGIYYCFASIYNYFEKRYKALRLITDKQCKNWNRHCFFSYDRNAYYNGESSIDYITIKKQSNKPFIMSDDEQQYTLSGSTKKVSCPKCKYSNRFRPYSTLNGSIIEGTGICDRINSCGTNIKPFEIYKDVKWKLVK